MDGGRGTWILEHITSYGDESRKERKKGIDRSEQYFHAWQKCLSFRLLINVVQVLPKCRQVCEKSHAKKLVLEQPGLV